MSHLVFRTAAGLLGLALLSAAPLPAQEPDGRDTLPAPADTLRLEELIVTVYRLPVPADALTSEVTVISGDELRERGIEHVAEALRLVPGAAVTRSGSFGGVTSLFLRGGESDYVKVLVDGVPINQPGGSFDFGALQADNVERIEVLRGPASVVYGSDAVSGVVQILTRRGSGPPSLEARARGGSFGTVALDGSLAGGGRRAGYGLSLSNYLTDGTLDFNNEYRSTAASGFVRLTPDERTRAEISARWTDHVFHFPTDGGGSPVDANQLTREDRLLLGFEASRWLGGRVEGVLHLGLAETDVGFDDAPDGPADTLGFFAFRSRDEISRRGAGGRVNVHVRPGTVLTAGADVEEQKIRGASRSESEFGPSTDRLEADRTNLGVFAQVVVFLAERLALTGAARLDDNDAFGTFDTYRLGAAYRLPSRTRLRASFGTGFKEPTFFENFAAGFALGNPDLRPERTRSVEAGIEQPLAGDRVTLSATWFDQRFRDLIQFTFAPAAAGEPNFFNVAEAKASGVELEAEARPVAGLSVGASYAYLDTEVLDAGFDSGEDATFVVGERLIRRPTHSAGLSIGYRRPGVASGRLTVSRVGERDDRDFSTFPAPRLRLPAYTRVDLALSVDALRGGGRYAITPVLRIDNLLDEAYEEVKNFPAPGRTVLAGARIGIGPGGER